MQLFTTAFFKYAFSFALVLLASFALLFATSYFGAPKEQGYTSCITSSGEPC